MDCLFWNELKHWDIQLLNVLFSPEEVDLIRNLPLSMQNVKDRRIWHYERNGKFTVRSAYHVARCINVSNGDGVTASSSSTSFAGEKLWKKLWSACVPGKVKICAWHECLDSLPTFSNLIKQQVTSEDSCVFYGTQVESTKHVLRDCSLERAVWFRSLGIKVDIGNRFSLLQWLHQITMQFPSLGLELCLMLI